jgi:hypothetical protein
MVVSRGTTGFPVFTHQACVILFVGRFLTNRYNWKTQMNYFVLDKNWMVKEESFYFILILRRFRSCSYFLSSLKISLEKLVNPI